MHRDVMALVDGGYSAQEIIDAFVGTYGERVLMAPRKSGFNLVAWLTPGLALVVGGFVVVFMLMRRWRGNAPRPVAPSTRRVRWPDRRDARRIGAPRRRDQRRRPRVIAAL